MRKPGLEGIRCVHRCRTTIPDGLAEKPPDLAGRQFDALHPNQLRVADHVCGDMEWLRLRRAYDRRLLKVYRWFVCLEVNQNRPCPRRIGTSDVGVREAH